MKYFMKYFVTKICHRCVNETGNKEINKSQIFRTFSSNYVHMKLTKDLNESKEEFIYDQQKKKCLDVKSILTIFQYF